MTWGYRNFDRVLSAWGARCVQAVTWLGDILLLYSTDWQCHPLISGLFERTRFCRIIDFMLKVGNSLASLVEESRLSFFTVLENTEGD